MVVANTEIQLQKNAQTNKHKISQLLGPCSPQQQYSLPQEGDTAVIECLRKEFFAGH